MVIDLRAKYQAELDEVIAQMAEIGRRMQEMDKHGVELTARANMLAGKIEVLDELSAAKSEGESCST